MAAEYPDYSYYIGIANYFGTTFKEVLDIISEIEYPRRAIYVIYKIIFPTA